MKSATILLAILVALLFFVPVQASAAGLPTVERSTFQLAPDGDSEPDEEEKDASWIVDLHATAARLRGRVELDWMVDGQAPDGILVVERSTNGSSWRPIKICSVRYDPTQVEYGCTDTRLISGTTYTYRVCITAKGATCSNASPSKPVAVKAP